MNEYKLTLGVEPTNDYQKAMLDLMKAKESISVLNPQEKAQLLRTAFAVELSNLSPDQRAILNTVMNIMGIQL